jgi:hypothetical protein
LYACEIFRDNEVGIRKVLFLELRCTVPKELIGIFRYMLDCSPGIIVERYGNHGASGENFVGPLQFVQGPVGHRFLFRDILTAGLNMLHIALVVTDGPVGPAMIANLLFVRIVDCVFMNKYRVIDGKGEQVMAHLLPVFGWN